MTIYRAPELRHSSVKYGGPPLPPTVFLAGTIEMGKAERWQDTVGERLSAAGWDVYNPRRDDWDAAWVQSRSNVQFSAQVLWEQRYLLSADAVIFHFEPGTQSPITLLELGQAAVTPRRGPTVVHCPEGFWRKGNVDIVCELNDLTEVRSLDEAADVLVKWAARSGRRCHCLQGHCHHSA